MDKLKYFKRVFVEITLIIVLYVFLCVFWFLIIKDSIVLSDEGLSTIGLALSSALGVLTALVTSFVLIIWQMSRQERSSSYWRWINALYQLDECFDKNIEVLPEIVEDVMHFSWEAHSSALISPMSRDKIKEHTSKVWDKITKVTEEQQKIKNPTARDVIKGRAYKDIGNHLVLLVTANFEHNLAHYQYRRVLSLRGLLYRLLIGLITSLFIVAAGVTTFSMPIPDLFNAPLAVALFVWVTYVLILLGLEIRKVSLLEDEFRRQEAEIKDFGRLKIN